MNRPYELAPAARWPQTKTVFLKKAKEMLGEQQLVDLMAVSGVYTVVSMLLNTAEVMPNDGSRPLPPPASR